MLLKPNAATPVALKHVAAKSYAAKQVAAMLVDSKPVAALLVAALLVAKPVAIKPVASIHRHYNLNLNFSDNNLLTIVEFYILVSFNCDNFFWHQFKLYLI